MFQLDLTIILVILNSLVFFGIGYYVGKDKRPIIEEEEHIEDPNWGKDIVRAQQEGNTVTFDPPLRYTPVNEPSGVVYRPTAKELTKMNEDKATREAKEAIEETLRKETPADNGWNV